LRISGFPYFFKESKSVIKNIRFSQVSQKRRKREIFQTLKKKQPFDLKNNYYTLFSLSLYNYYFVSAQNILLYYIYIHTYIYIYIYIYVYIYNIIICTKYVI